MTGTLRDTGARESPQPHGGALCHRGVAGFERWRPVDRDHVYVVWATPKKKGSSTL